MLKHVQTVSVQVRDQERALEFYTNVLEFEKTDDQPMDETSRWLVVAPSGAQTGIMLEQGDGANLPSRFTGYIFYTDNMEATHATLTERGVQFTAPPRVEPWGRWAQFMDLDGNEFGLWANPGETA